MLHFLGENLKFTLPDCDNGYYGDGCNSSCNCSTDAICDKEAGACLPKVLSPGKINLSS